MSKPRREQLSVSAIVAHEKQANPEPDEVSTIRLPRPIWTLLRIVAARRRSAGSGKPNISAVVLHLIRQHEAELRAEAARNE
jgi:hypothetical protein